MTGIYAILNIIDGHCYIGSAINLDMRKRSHFNLLYKRKHHNLYLQNAYNLYKENAFIFHIIEYCNKEILVQREQFWIDNYKLRGEILYNICPVAYSRIGTKHSEETKAKIAKANKGKTYGRIYLKENEEEHRIKRNTQRRARRKAKKGN